MISNSRFAPLFLLALGLALGAVPASADTAYNYTGSDYTIAGAPYTTSMDMTWTFSVASPLSDNLNDSDISSEITSWQFTDGVGTYDSSDAILNTAEISTGSTGAIDGWDFSVTGFADFPPFIEELQSDSASGDSVAVYFILYPFPITGASNASLVATPEPPSGVYLALGLLVLGAFAVGKRRLRPQLA